MGYYNSRGLRGSYLEELINLTNNVYREKNLAIIQKIPTPITPVKINNENKTITLAYFNAKSTVDYIGVVQGIPVCFDAKETSHKFLPLQNIHQHQIEFMEEFEQQQGVAFMIIYFKIYDKYYYLPFKDINEFWQNVKNGGRKSIPISFFQERYLIKGKGNFYVHYLEALNTYLTEKNL